MIAVGLRCLSPRENAINRTLHLFVNFELFAGLSGLLHDFEPVFQLTSSVYNLRACV